MTVLFYPNIFGETIYDCMAASEEFETWEDLKEWLYQTNKKFISKDDIILSDEVFDDERVGIEDARMILFKKFWDTVFEHPYCWGYCALKYNPEQIERSKLEVDAMLGLLTVKGSKRLNELRIKYN